jgi:heat-inducible transcriptional repressor
VVQTRVFQESSCTTRQLEAASERLTELVHGLTLGQARARLARAIEREIERSDALWRRVFLLGRQSLEARGEPEVYLGDSQVLLEQPEFEDVDALRQVHAALAEKERLLNLLERTLEADVIHVAMGDDLSTLGVERCAVVSAGLGGAAGGLGVIGPLRMRYDRVIPAVRDVSRRVNDYFG